MYVDEKKLEEKKNASFDIITSSLCLSRDTPGHVIRIQQWRNHVFNRSFHQKKTTIYYSTPTFNWQEEIQQLVCWPEELEDRWSQKSEFLKYRSCDFIDLNTIPASRSPSVTGSADKK